MNETLFYVLGIGLVAAALAVAVIGLRWERFPTSKGLLAGVTVAFAALVIATASFAWLSAEDEQEHREAELAEAAAEGGETEAAEAVGGEAVEEAAPTAVAAEGAALFDSAGCSGCHTLADAGSTAQTGPALDGALEGKSTRYIETAIVDPNDSIAKGYPPDVMPRTFGEDLTPAELDALVGYLAEATGTRG